MGCSVIITMQVDQLGIQPHKGRNNKMLWKCGTLGLLVLLAGCNGVQINIYGDGPAASMCRDVERARSEAKPQPDDPGAVYH